MIFKSGVKIGYKDLQNIFIFSKNLALIIENSAIIDNNLKKNLNLYQVVHIPILSISFILLLLGLIPKYNWGFKQIYHLFNSKKKSVNNNIPDNTKKLKYTKL